MVYWANSRCITLCKDNDIWANSVESLTIFFVQITQLRKKRGTALISISTAQSILLAMGSRPIAFLNGSFRLLPPLC